MAIVKEIPFISKQGCKYIIEFCKETNDLDLYIVSANIVLLADKNSGLLFEDIKKIADIFKSYLTENKSIVLCYVCDNRECFFNRKNKNLTALEYRKKLFDAIFTRLNKGDEFYKRNAKITIKNEVEHFSFIGFKENSDIVDKCTDFVFDKLNKH